MGTASTRITTTSGFGTTAPVPAVAGPYSIKESWLPKGWSLKGASCTDGITTFSPEDFLINPGDNVVCTFENVKDIETTYTLTFIVTDPTGAPIPDAIVSYRNLKATTDEIGIAQIMIPAGDYNFAIRKKEYIRAVESVHVDGNMEVPVELVMRK